MKLCDLWTKIKNFSCIHHILMWRIIIQTLMEMWLCGVFFRRPKSKNGSSSGTAAASATNSTTAQAVATAAHAQAMIPMRASGESAGRMSPPLRTYTGSIHAHRHHNSNTSRRDNYAKTDIIFLIVFPLLFIAFNICYWSALYVWRFHDPVMIYSDDDE